MSKSILNTESTGEMKFPVVQNFVNGEFSENSYDLMDVISPIDGSVISKVPMCGTEQLDQAVSIATPAQKEWGKKPPRERAQVLYRYRDLLKQHRDELAEITHLENGKTIPEATAEVDKSIEIVEFACSTAQFLTGESLTVSNGVQCTMERYPIGVVASITPFNFPVMVPHWTIPNAIVTGNAMILKPSEVVPLSAVRTAELLTEAGLPKGLFQIVNGGKEMVEAICDHPGINGVSFVGSTAVAKIVYTRCSVAGKPVMAMGGAKNHLVVMPDANPEMTAQDVTASFTGCAGQRCMAASVLLAVGNVDSIIDRIIDYASMEIKTGETMGSVISEAAKNRIERYISEAEKSGADIRLDGRNTTVVGKEKGFYVGPTIIDNAQPDAPCNTEEIFGPVISIIRTKTLEEAISIENSSSYGNAAAIYTQSGLHSSEFSKGASSGMIGVNIGVPVPREPFSFGGWNDSRFGSTDITGSSSLEFWTRLKKTTTKWFQPKNRDWMS